MSQRFFRAAIVGALVMSGCASQPTAPAPSGAVGADATAAYRVAAAHFAQIALHGVTASSTSVRDTRWWDVGNAVDGNTHSSWKPADDDATPELTLDLGGEKHVTALAIKLDDHPITFDVAAWVDGAWTTIATEARPGRYQVLDTVTIPDVTTAKLKLTFHHVGDPTGSTVGTPPNVKDVPARVSVCEVQAFTDQLTPGTPSPLPTQAPGGATCLRLAGEGVQFTDDGRNGYFFTFRTGITAENGILGHVSIASTAGHSGTTYDVERIVENGDDVVVTASRGGYAPERVVVTLHMGARQGDVKTGYVSRFQLKNDVAGFHDDYHYSQTGMQNGETFTRPAFVEETLDACDDGPAECLKLSGTALLRVGDGYEIDLRNDIFESTALGGFGSFYFYNFTTKVSSRAFVEHVAIEGDALVSTGRFDDMVVQGGMTFRHGTYRLEVDRATGAIRRLVQTVDGAVIDATATELDTAGGHLSLDQDCDF